MTITSTELAGLVESLRANDEAIYLPLLGRAADAITALTRQIAERDAENKRLREALRLIYVDATEQHSDWCNMGPVEDEARDWAFAISIGARQALGGDK